MFILKYILPHFIVLVKVGGIASLSANLTVSLQLGGQSMSTTTVQGEATATSNASLPLFTDFPEQSQTGQYGTNRCGTTDSQNCRPFACFMCDEKKLKNSSQQIVKRYT